MQPLPAAAQAKEFIAAEDQPASVLEESFSPLGAQSVKRLVIKEDELKDSSQDDIDTTEKSYDARSQPASDQMDDDADELLAKSKRKRDSPKEPYTNTPASKARRTTTDHSPKPRRGFSASSTPAEERKREHPLTRSSPASDRPKKHIFQRVLEAYPSPSASLLRANLNLPHPSRSVGLEKGKDGITLPTIAELIGSADDSNESNEPSFASLSSSFLEQPMSSVLSQEEVRGTEDSGEQEDDSDVIRELLKQDRHMENGQSTTMMKKNTPVNRLGRLVFSSQRVGVLSFLQSLVPLMLLLRIAKTFQYQKELKRRTRQSITIEPCPN